MKGRRRSIYLNLFLELRTVLFFCQWTVILSLVYSRQRTWQFFLFSFTGRVINMNSSKTRKYIFGFFWDATKSNKTNVFEVSCLQVYERFRDTQSSDFAPLHHRSPISVRRKPKIHCHCFLFLFFFLSCWLFNLPWLGTSTMIPQNMIYVVPLHKNEFLFRRIENCSRFQLITVLSVWELFAEPSIGYLPPEMKEALSIHWANLSGWSHVCDQIHHEIKYLISLEFHLLASAGTQFIPFVQQILQG